MSMCGDTYRKPERRRAHRRKYVHLPFAYRVRCHIFYRFLFVSCLLVAAVIFLPFAFYQYFSEDSLFEYNLPEALARQYGASRPVDPLSSLAEAIGGNDAPPTQMEAETAPEVSPTEISLQSILETYRAATGLRDTQSLFLHGEYVEDGRRFEMKLAAKAPDLVRKTLNDEKLSMICSYDGETATVEVDPGTGQNVSQAIEDPLYQNAIILEGAFLSLADTGVELLSPRHSWEPEQAYEGKAHWTVASRLPDSPLIHHLIDPDTGFERVRYLEVAVEGTRHQISMHFSDFRESGGHTLPHAYEIKVNGTLRGQGRIHSIQSNRGLMPWMF